MPLAPVDRELRVDVARCVVHRLHEKVFEVELFVLGKTLVVLRHHDFQLVAFRHDKRRVGFRTHANPVDALEHRQRTVRFDRHFEAGFVQRIDERLVDLQHRLAARAHDEFVRLAFRPQRCDLRDEFRRRFVLATVFAIGADEIGVAKLADGVRAIFLAPRPQIAARETAEHGRTPGIGAFALQRVENFLYRVRHDCSVNL